MYDRMDFWVILYSLVCTIVGGGSVTFLYKRGQTIGALVVLVLLILIFIFYGLRWFPSGNLNGSTPSSDAWPPIVNMCPDFMVSWTDTTTPDKVYCYDANNVYDLRTATAMGPLEAGLTINGVSGQSAYLIKDPSKSKVASIEADSPTSPYFPLAKKLTVAPNDVLTTAAKFLRWEGVWDGQNLKADKIPLLS
jgi:hypothetical protein